MDKLTIITLFRTHTEEMFDMHCDFINSLKISTRESKVEIELIIIENNSSGSNEQIYWKDKFAKESSVSYASRRIKDLGQIPFNMNKFYNIGEEESIFKDDKSSFICFCNSDLVFRPGWWEAVKEGFEKAGPDVGTIIPASSIPTFQFDQVTANGSKSFEGFRVGPPFFRMAPLGVSGPGWMFLFKRSTWDTLKPWPEEFRGWYQDWEIYRRMQDKGLKSYAIYSGTVDHLEGRSFKKLRSENPAEFKALTNDQKPVYERVFEIENASNQSGYEK